MIENYKYSVIIPHYNEPERLRRLLKSIPAREDIQIIVIDDCSPSQILINEIKNEFFYIDFLSTPKNEGAGSARNIGLKNAKGYFILFADADDEFHPDAFEIFDQAVLFNADIYYFRADAIIEETGEKSTRADQMNSLVDKFLEKKNKENELNLKLKHCIPVAKIYKKKFIEKTKVKFDEIPVSNDIYFNIINGVLAEKIYVSKENVYIIYKLKDSLTSTLTADRLLCRLQASAKLAADLKKLGIKHDLSASGFIAQSIYFGVPTFLKALTISIKSDLKLNINQIANISRWRRFLKTKKQNYNIIKK